MKRMLPSILVCFTCLIVEHDVCATITPAAKTYLDTDTIGVDETGWLSQSLPSGLDFARYVATNCQEVLSTFTAIAPDARRQKLVIVAAEFMTPHDYVTFINGVCDLKAQGKVSYDVFKLIVSAKMVKSDFLAYNYDQADVTNLIARLATIMQTGEPGIWTSIFADMQSGSAKTTVISARTQDSEIMPESYNGAASDAYHQLTGQ